MHYDAVDPHPEAQHLPVAEAMCKSCHCLVGADRLQHPAAFARRRGWPAAAASGQ